MVKRKVQEEEEEVHEQVPRKRQNKKNGENFSSYMVKVFANCAKELPEDEDGNRPTISVEKSAAVFMHDILKTFIQKTARSAKKLASSKGKTPKTISSHHIAEAIKFTLRPRATIMSTIANSGLLLGDVNHDCEAEEKIMDDFVFEALEKGTNAVQTYEKSKEE